MAARCWKLIIQLRGVEPDFIIEDDLPLARVDLVKNRRPKSTVFLSMGYKKDIFAVFAYEFELLQK